MDSRLLPGRLALIAALVGVACRAPAPSARRAPVAAAPADVPPGVVAPAPVDASARAELHAAVLVPGGDEDSRCVGDEREVVVARPSAPSFEVTLPPGATTLRLRARSAGPHALVALTDADDDAESCALSADHAAALDLRAARAGERYRVFVASADGARAPVAVTWTTDGSAPPAPAEPAVPPPRPDEVRASFELALQGAADEEPRLRATLVLTGAVTRRVPIPGEQYGACSGDRDVPGFTCVQGGEGGVALRSRGGRWELVSHAQSDGACPDGHGGVGACPVDRRVLRRVEMPPGVRVVTDPSGAMRLVGPVPAPAPAARATESTASPAR